MNPFESALTQLQKAALVAGVAPRVIARLSKPHRIIEVQLPVIRDNGTEELFTSYRVQYNNARGPYKGGIRFHPQVNKDEVQALGLWMAIKCAVAGIPMGGGKGGVIVDPKSLSVAELERLSRAFIQGYVDVLGPTKDVPAPDVYTTPQIMAWMADEYQKLTNDPHAPAVITGKPIENGGSEGRGTATAQGGYYVLAALAEKKAMTGSLSVAIQGFGNAGSVFAEIAAKNNHKVVAVSDSSGGIYKQDGLDIAEVAQYKKEKGTLSGFPNAQSVTNDQLLELNADILVPAALENQITGANADRIKAKVVLELANGPTSPDADEILFKKGIPVVPDVLSNSGGVSVSYFEWDQNMKGEHWTAEQVDEKLRKVMHDGFTAVYDFAQEKNVPLRTAAFAVALKRIEEAMT